MPSEEKPAVDVQPKLNWPKIGPGKTGGWTQCPFRAYKQIATRTTCALNLLLTSSALKNDGHYNSLIRPPRTTGHEVDLHF